MLFHRLLQSMPSIDYHSRKNLAFLTGTTWTCLLLLLYVGDASADAPRGLYKMIANSGYSISIDGKRLPRCAGRLRGPTEGTQIVIRYSKSKLTVDGVEWYPFGNSDVSTFAQHEVKGSGMRSELSFRRDTGQRASGTLVVHRLTTSGDVRCADGFVLEGDFESDTKIHEPSVSP